MRIHEAYQKTSKKETSFAPGLIIDAPLPLEEINIGDLFAYVSGNYVYDPSFVIDAEHWLAVYDEDDSEGWSWMKVALA